MTTELIAVKPPRATAEQRAANIPSAGIRPPATRYFEAAPCEGPGCSNIVSAGQYPVQRKRSFCSNLCANRDAATKYVLGKCLCGCGQDVLGSKNKIGKKRFYDDEHRRHFHRERMLAPTGGFRPMVEQYLQVEAPIHYKPGTLSTVQTSVTKFFRFVASLGFKDVNEVRPATISQFIASQLRDGAVARNYIGHLSTFFRWLIEEDRYHRPNPVIPRRHYLYEGGRDPRPYTDNEIARLWAIVEASGKLELMLAFVIGQECGLRVGEVANIRLGDIDFVAQTIFVRLPTKNDRTRTVPFHDKVRKYLELWLKQRNPHTTTDHLLLNMALTGFNGNRLDARFRYALRQHPEPAASFAFHRLRHTWATRLMNNGMELAVLKELGGWVSWNSMQRYIKVLDSTVQRQYQAAYKKLQFSPDPGEEEEYSLMDFALMKTPVAATPADSAA